MDERQPPTTIRILGIDPGSRITGYGVIDLVGIKPRYVASGCIRTAEGALEQRLAQIYAGISEVVGLHRPDAVAVERVFMAKNADSAPDARTISKNAITRPTAPATLEARSRTCWASSCKNPFSLMP